MDQFASLAAVIMAIVIAVAVVLYVSGHSNQQTAQRLRRLEDKVDLLVEQAGLTPPVDQELEPVRQLAQQGEKIRAIKLHREITGSGLAEAKAAVDRMA